MRNFWFDTSEYLIGIFLSLIIVLVMCYIFNVKFTYDMFTGMMLCLIYLRTIRVENKL